ncbi:hypothetical protein Pint_04028 [Pistacia integerrima]|uniref:Uncharacterized protein n=1 Tax=Pistacia integerrima TaxID=434235 RepID=A0ACC0Z2J3_9ROSI|nr:hypothetical protein Pint_04028 [Pistacia integerrima]
MTKGRINNPRMYISFTGFPSGVFLIIQRTIGRIKNTTISIISHMQSSQSNLCVAVPINRNGIDVAIHVAISQSMEQDMPRRPNSEFNTLVQ